MADGVSASSAVGVSGFESQVPNEVPSEAPVEAASVFSDSNSNDTSTIDVSFDELSNIMEETKQQVEAESSESQSSFFDHGNGTFNKYTYNSDGSQDIVNRFYDEDGVLMESRIYVTPDGEHQNVGYLPV